MYYRDDQCYFDFEFCEYDYCFPNYGTCEIGEDSITWYFDEMFGQAPLSFIKNGGCWGPYEPKTELKYATEGQPEFNETEWRSGEQETSRSPVIESDQMWWLW